MCMSTMGLSSETTGIPKAHPDDGGLVVHRHHVALLLVDEALQVLQQRANRASIQLQMFHKDGVRQAPWWLELLLQLAACLWSALLLPFEASTLYLSGTGCSPG